jgi:broad specificity phosphatase PhoE
MIIARHGQTESNAAGRYQGSIDTDLDEVGAHQAADLHVLLPGTIGAVVSSPMRRALRTAQIFSAQRGLTITTHGAFHERGVGIFEGLTPAEVREAYPQLWARNITRRWDESPPQGESIAQVFARVHAGLLDLSQRSDHDRLLLVAHGFVSKCARAIVLERVDDFFGWQLGNGQHLHLDIGDVRECSLERLGVAFIAAHAEVSR